MAPKELRRNLLRDSLRVSIRSSMEGLSDSLLLVKRGFALPSGCKALLMMSPFGMTGFHSNFCRKYCAICTDFFILFAHYKAIEPLIKRGGKISDSRFC